MQYFKKQAKRTRRQLNKKINNKARPIIKVQAPKAHIHAQLHQPKGLNGPCLLGCHCIVNCEEHFFRNAKSSLSLIVDANMER